MGLDRDTLSRNNRRKPRRESSNENWRETVRRCSDPEYVKYEERYERRAAFKSSKRKKGRKAVNHGRTSRSSVATRRRRGLRPFRILFLLLIIFAIAGIFFLKTFFSMTENLDRVDTDGKDFAINPVAEKNLQGYRNIAILGVDARKGEGYDGSRADAIIIMSIRRSDGRIHLISVMRDSYLKLNGINGELSFDKITHAHHYGGGLDTCAALNRNLDLNIREYVVFDWKAVSDTVDALGGIEVDVKKNEIYDMNHWGPETARNVGGRYKDIETTGVQEMDGIQAVTYCRIRKNSGGDVGRGKRYKKIMKAVVKKAVVSPGKLDYLAKEVMPQIRTNMDRSSILSAGIRAPFYKFEKSISWPREFYGGMIGGVWYAVPRTLESNVKWLHSKAFDVDYVASSQVVGISNEIMYKTGVNPIGSGQVLQ